MKRVVVSIAFVAAFGLYAAYQYFGAPTSIPVYTASTSIPTAPAPRPSSPAGQWTDGTYVGSNVDAYYGYVQVRATISLGRLTNVAFLSYPNDRSTSRYISAQSMPILTSEAIRAQSANVDTVSGATDTSRAFRQSLESALAQAK